MCFKCDSVWVDGQAVSNHAGTTFDKHMHSFGVEANWEDIKRIHKVE